MTFIDRLKNRHNLALKTSEYPINMDIYLKCEMASSKLPKIQEEKVFFKECDDSTALECMEMVNSAFKSDKAYSDNVDCEKYARFTVELFDKIRKNGRIRIAFLKTTNEMIGSFCLTPYLDKVDDVMRKIIYLEAISVSVNFQKRGVSKVLLLEVERMGKEMSGYAIEGGVLDFADWEISRLVAEADATVLERHKVTKIDFPRVDALKRETVISKLRKVIEY